MWVLIAIAIVAAVAAIASAFIFRFRATLELLGKVSAWLERYWSRIHTLAAPYGIAFSTLLLSVRVFEAKWQFWLSWDIIQSTASLGAVVYAVIAISVEVLLTMVFYALGQIHKIIESNRKYREALVEARRQQVLQEGRQEGMDVERQAWQAWYDQQVADGVQMPSPPPVAATSATQ